MHVACSAGQSKEGNVCLPLTDRRADDALADPQTGAMRAIYQGVSHAATFAAVHVTVSPTATLAMTTVTPPDTPDGERVQKDRATVSLTLLCTMRTLTRSSPTPAPLASQMWTDSSRGRRCNCWPLLRTA
jgi:hypothetical protein